MDITRALLITLMIPLVVQAQQPPAKVTTDSTIPRTINGKPDFTGYWNLPYVPNIANGKESEMPYTDLGRKAFQDHDSKDDPTSFCLYPGVPRIMQSPYPVQFRQTADYFLMLFEYMRLWRAVPLDGRPNPENMQPEFMGYSTGRWEGDTLVVDTTLLKGAPWTWLDTAGHQLSDQLSVVEKFQRTPEGIDYEYSVIDPIMYAKPLVQRRKMTPLKVLPGLPELLEYSCNENNKDVEHLVPNKPNSK
jgi:hypothetical protein